MPAALDKLFLISEKLLIVNMLDLRLHNFLRITRQNLNWKRKKNHPFHSIETRDVTKKFPEISIVIFPFKIWKFPYLFETFPFLVLNTVYNKNLNTLNLRNVWLITVQHQNSMNCPNFLFGIARCKQKIWIESDLTGNLPQTCKFL